MRKTILLTAILLTSMANIAAGPSLSIGSTTVKAGRELTVEVALGGGGDTVAALTADVSYDASVLTPEGVATSVPGKVVQGAVVSPGVYRFTLYGGRGSMPEGTVVVLRFSTVKDRCGSYALAFASAPAASTAEAAPISLEGRPGAATLERCRKATGR